MLGLNENHFLMGSSFTFDWYFLKPTGLNPLPALLLSQVKGTAEYKKSGLVSQVNVLLGILIQGKELLQAAGSFSHFLVRGFQGDQESHLSCAWP